MAFFQQAIKFYPNLLNFYSTTASGTRDTALNYDPDAEPSLTGETYSCSGGQTTGPLYDTVDNKLKLKCTIDTNAQSTSPQFDWDLSSSITVYAVIIGEHNLGTVGGALTVTLKYNAGASTAGCNTAYSGKQHKSGYYLTAAETVASNPFPVTADGMTVAHFNTGYTHTDWQLLFETGSSYAANMSIGEISLCGKWTAPHAPETDGWQDANMYGVNVKRSRGGQNYGFMNYGERKQITLQWNNLAQANYDSLIEVFRVTKGSLYPLWVDLGEHATLSYMRYMRLVGEVVGTPIAGGLYWNVSVTLMDEL